MNTSTNITTFQVSTIEQRKALLGRLFKEDKITMDEMLLLLEPEVRTVFQPAPNPWDQIKFGTGTSPAFLSAPSGTIKINGTSITT
jgi:hypothetical protein